MKPVLQIAVVREDLLVGAGTGFFRDSVIRINLVGFVQEPPFFRTMYE
jgi:hypothetical protein